MSTSRLAFAQNEAIANDYYQIRFCERNQVEEVPYYLKASHHVKKFPYKICEICIVSFDTQMNCIKTHIHIVNKRDKHWLPEMQSFHGKIEFINDSTVAYTSNSLINATDDYSKAIIRILYFPDPMSSVEEEFVIRSSSIRKVETGWTLYQLEDLQLKRIEQRELKNILKICGLQMKNNRIKYPVKIFNFSPSKVVPSCLPTKNNPIFAP